jgi:Fe-S-cluster containining protein
MSQVNVASEDQIQDEGKERWANQQFPVEKLDMNGNGKCVIYINGETKCRQFLWRPLAIDIHRMLTEIPVVSTAYDNDSGIGGQT